MKYRYRSDEEMKDSGVEWIGKIPKGVEQERLKYDVKFEKGSNPKNLNINYEGLPYVGASDFGNKNYKIFTTDTNLPICDREDLLILWDGARAGIVDYGHEGVVSSTIVKVKNLSENIYSKYFNWYMKSFEKYLIDMSNGTTIPHMNRKFIENLHIIKFPIDYQKKITNFLDEKTSDFDNIISKKEKLIEKLEEAKKSLISEGVTGKVKVVKNGDDFEIVKREDSEMKDSGVEWIGKIPKDWEVKRIKYLFDIKKNIAGELGYDVLSVTQSGIKIKDITKNGGQLSMDYSKYQIVEIDDFIMNHMDLLTGFVDCSKFKGVTSPDYRVFRLKGYNNCKEYYNYILQLCYYNRIFYSLARGVSGMGRWRLQTETFKNFIVPMPKIEEQERIAKFILKKTNDIDILKNKLKINIEKLKEAKQALISEAVTGKIEILD